MAQELKFKTYKIKVPVHSVEQRGEYRKALDLALGDATYLFQLISFYVQNEGRESFPSSEDPLAYEKLDLSSPSPTARRGKGSARS